MLNLVDLRFRVEYVPLLQIDVSVSDIRDEGLQHLLGALVCMKAQLLVLKAGKSNLTFKSGDILAKFLDECNDLEELWIGGNKLGVKGLKPLCKALRNHPNISVLDVSANSIGNSGGEELGAVLTTSKSMTEIDCSWNDFSGDDGQYLLGGLALSSSIQMFRGCWNRFGKMAMPELKEILARPQIWYELDLRNCGNVLCPLLFVERLPTTIA